MVPSVRAVRTYIWRRNTSRERNTRLWKFERKSNAEKYDQRRVTGSAAERRNDQVTLLFVRNRMRIDGKFFAVRNIPNDNSVANTIVRCSLTVHDVDKHNKNSLTKNDSFVSKMRHLVKIKYISNQWRLPFASENCDESRDQLSSAHGYDSDFQPQCDGCRAYARMAITASLEWDESS